MSKDLRKHADPWTPPSNVPIPIRSWDVQINSWKNKLDMWNKNYIHSNDNLRKNTSIKDRDHTCQFESEVNRDFAIVKLTNAKRAFIHVKRIWCYNQPMYGGWKSMRSFQNKFSYAVNARSIEPIKGIEYQVTFAHTTKSGNTYTKLAYTSQMEEWLEKIVTLDKLNEELKTFKYVYSK